MEVVLELPMHVYAGAVLYAGLSIDSGQYMPMYALRTNCIESSSAVMLAGIGFSIS